MVVVQTRKASRYVEAKYIRRARATIKHLVGMRRDSARVGRASSTDERQIQQVTALESASGCVSGNAQLWYYEKHIGSSILLDTT